MEKVVLITGTSTGLGLKAAVLLAKQGHKVYATMRNLNKKDLLLKEAADANVSIELLRLDVQDTASIKDAVASIIEKEDRLDVLINNAGAGFARNTEQTTEEELQWVTDVNYHGVVRCTNAVLPQMRKQKSGHIINVTSVGGLVGQPFNELYCAAKFAVEGYTESLALILPKYFGINITAVEPGGISTEFFNSAAQITFGENGMPDDDYAPIFQAYLSGVQARAAASQETTFQTPEEVAGVILNVMDDTDPPVRIRTSAWAENFCKLKTASDPNGKKLRDQVIAQNLD
ncbi:MAG: SDR family oxidoreductase [Roseivirga sp.]